MLERHELRFATLEKTVGEQQETIGEQQKTIRGLVKWQADADALLDLRQCSILLQPEITEDFLKERLLFRDLNEKQRTLLEHEASAVYRIANRFGVDGGNFVHWRRRVTASRLKDYILDEPGGEFSAQDVQAFLVYFNRVLRKLRRDPSLDVFTQEVALGTEDKHK